MNTNFERNLDKTRKSLPKAKALLNNRWNSAGGVGNATPVFTKQVDCMQSVICSHLCTPMCRP